MTSLPLSPIKYQDQRDSLVNSINYLRKNNHTNLIYMGTFFFGPNSIQEKTTDQYSS